VSCDFVFTLILALFASSGSEFGSGRLSNVDLMQIRNQKTPVDPFSAVKTQQTKQRHISFTLSSVADPGSEIRDPVLFYPLDPE
jgi:hypothetical protein